MNELWVSRYCLDPKSAPSLCVNPKRLEISDDSLKFSISSDQSLKIKTSNLVSVLFPSHSKSSSPLSLFASFEWRNDSQQRSTRGNAQESGLWVQFDSQSLEGSSLADARKRLNTLHEQLGFTINYDSAITAIPSPFDAWKSFSQSEHSSSQEVSRDVSKEGFDALLSQIRAMKSRMNKEEVTAEERVKELEKQVQLKEKESRVLNELLKELAELKVGLEIGVERKKTREKEKKILAALEEEERHRKRMQEILCDDD